MLKDRLDEEGILEEARRRAGSDDFGEPETLEGLGVLLRSLEDEARLNAQGRALHFERIVGLLTNRARATAWFAAYPEIDDEVLDDPIVVVGLPRTASTMLHRTLAAAPALRALQWWESRNPAPWPGWSPERAAGSADPRIASAEAEIATMLAANPELAAVHPFEANSPDEEIMLLEHAFMSGTPPAFARVPGYFEWLEGQDNAPAYRYMKRLLQLLQWQKRARGESGTRWVLKAPHHLMHLDLLFACFPRATVIQTHRDVLEVVPSYASMISEIHSMSSDAVDRREIGERWSRRWSRALSRSLEERAHFGEQRFVDVWYEDAVRDPIAEAERVYERVGMCFTGATRDAMLRWAELNRREARPRHRYTLDEYGFDADSLARDFSAYRERFILPRTAAADPRQG